MRGHQALIAMRRRGYMPSVVWLATSPGVLPTCSDWQDMHPRHCHLQIEPGDRPRTMDLHYLVGLTVCIDGEDAKQVAALTEACVEAKAGRVIASVQRAVVDRGVPSFEVVSVTDTAGHFQ